MRHLIFQNLVKTEDFKNTCSYALKVKSVRLTKVISSLIIVMKIYCRINSRYINKVQIILSSFLIIS